MADYVDWAAEYLRGAAAHKDLGEHMKDPDFPWVGLASDMFSHLATRGFVMGPRVHWPPMEKTNA